MDKLPRIPSPPGTVWREFRVTVMPFIVFAAVLGLTAVTWRNYVGPSSLVGEVEAVRAPVAAPQAGRIVELGVRHMERVSKGQLLGRVVVADPKVLQANLALSKARIELIRMSPVPELRLGNNGISFENLRLRWLEQRLSLAIAKSDLTYYEAEFARAQKLFSELLISQASLDLARKNVEITRTKIDEQTKLLAEAEIAIRSVKPADPSPSVDGMPGSVKAAMDVEQRNLDLLEAQLAPLPLVCPIDGVVSVVHHRVNESVAAKKLKWYICDFPAQKLTGKPGVVALPHLGASTREAEDNCAIMVADQLREYLEHGNILNAVNFPDTSMTRESPFRIGIANSNFPNMLGQISTAMADAGLNIHNMLNKSKGEMAYTLVDVDSAVSDEVVARIAAIKGVLAVRYLPLERA